MQTSLRWRLAQFLELRWWKHYLKGKSQVDYLADKRSYWKKVLQQLAYAPKENDRVLDAGCGPAGIFILLHDQQRVTALDPLLDDYATALTVFDPKDYPEVHFTNASIEKAILDQAPFDVIYCFNAINHVNDWSLALDQLTAWSAPNTVLILASDVHRHPWLLPIFRALPGDALHPHQHRAEDYRKALIERGWTIVNEQLLRRELIFDYRAWVLVKG
ncbi:MAG: class I SAM-dependent methyltransferase [Bacteroidota bacterium]